MKINNVTAIAGEDITVDLEIINEDQFVAFQLDIPLPAGFDYVSGSAQLNPERKIDHQIQANILPSTNIFRCIAFSFVNTPFIGNEGVVASFAFSTPPSGGIYTFAIQDAVISNASAQNILSGVINGTITLIGSQVYTVTFSVTDPDQNPISDASITFNSITYSPGDYIIHGIALGEYDYIVEKEGYQSTSGTVIITYEDVTVNVILEPVISQNIMQLSDVTAIAGEDITVDLEIINEDQFVAFQLDIPLPAGFDYVSGSAQLNPERKIDHQIQANILPSTNIFRCIAFSFVNTPFIGNEGVVVSFAFSTPPSGGIYTFAIQDAVISNASAQNIISETIDGIITLLDPVLEYVLFLYANPEEGGIISGYGIYNVGDSVNISAIPNIGWNFVNWTDVEGNLISNLPEHIFSMPAEDLTLVANFEMTGYTLTLIANPEDGGAVIGSGIYNAGNTINIIATPNEGWTFINWTDSEGNLISNQSEYSFLMPAENLTLIANFEMIGYILTLIANPEEGGIVIDSGIYNAGDTINIIAIPNSGWEFINWTDSEGNIVSNQSEYSFLMPAENLTLIANFEMTGYILTLIANPEEGGTVIGSGIYNAGDTVNISANPNTGWEFINWTDAEGNIVSNQSEYSFLMPAENLTLIANFEMTGYTLTLIANPEEGGTVIGSGIYNVGDTVNISANPIPGWNFINWTDSEGNLISNQSEYSFLMPAEDHTLVANFEMIGYTLTLVANPEEGGTVIGSGIYNAGDTVNIISISNLGWAFINWTDSEGNIVSNQPEYSFLMPAENLTLVANFEMTGYTLTLIANPEDGGAVIGSGIYNAGNTINIIATPNEGWTFINWTDSEGNLISNQSEYSFLMPAEDLTLIANFEMTGYTLMLVANPEEGGTVIGSGIYNAGDTVNIIAIPITGWEFINWTDAEGNIVSNQSEYSFLMPAENLTLVANFEMTGYILTLIANPEEGGTVIGSGIYNAGDTVNIIAISNLGWAFINWTDSEGNIVSNQPEYSFTMPAEDLILIANFEMTGYILTLIANPEEGGTVIGSGIYNVGDTVNISANPNTGWNFINWIDSEGNFISNQSAYSFLMPAEDLILIANFEMTGYTLTLIANPEDGGAVIGSGIYNAGDTVNISAIPNTGWNFINWTDTEGNLISNQSEYSFLMPAENLTLVANFEMTGYILTLVANPEEGGTVVGSGIYNAGDTVNISAMPNTGWNFINWTDTEGNLISNQPEYSFTMPAEDLILIANFEMTGYILTLIANPEEGGTVMGSGIYNVGDTVNISANPNSGWNFINWTDAEGNLISNQSAYSFLMPAEDLILIASFEMTGYTLTLIANPEEGGTVMGSGIYNAGDTVNIIAISNLGWAFINWTDSEGNIVSNQPEYSFTMPAEDLILIANFEMTGYILTLIANPEEGGTVIGSGIYNVGDTVNISANPNTGWNFINWIDSEGNFISNQSAYSFLMPAEDLILIANFEMTGYTLTLIANPEDGGAVIGSGIYNAGDTVNISAIPNTGWNFINWTDTEGNLISNQSEYSFLMPAENLTLVANFEMTGYILTLVANPEEGGTVVGSGIYNAGDTVNISAMPNTGWNFINWTDTEGNLISNQPEYSFTMPAEDLILIANFEMTGYILTLIANPEEGGTVMGSGIYNVGDTVNISANPNSGWNFINWTDAEGNLISNQSAYSFLMPAEDLILIANFEMTGYILTLIANPEEGGIVIDSGIYNAGDTINIIAIPNSGWEFINWTDSEGNLISNQSAYSFLMPAEDLTLIANFEMTGYTLMLVANPEEGGTVVGSGTYNAGNTVNISVNPNTGWEFINWTDSEGNLISNQSAYSFLMPAEDLTLIANFEMTGYTLMLVANPEEGGTVVGSGTYNAGNTVNISVNPNTGWEFINWTDSEGNLISNQSAYSFLMPAEDLTLIANFEMTGYILTLVANPEEGGAVVGSGIYNAGDTINIIATPNTGWNFINWTDTEGNLISNQPEYSFLMPAEDLTLIANFEMTGYILTLIANPEEGGTVIGSGIYNIGDIVNISAIPITGWNFINWTDSEGNFISNQSAYSFLMPAENLTLVANFEMTGYTLTLIANPEEGGTVIGSGIYNAGDTVNIIAISNLGWAFINWTDSEGNIVSNQSEYSFLMPAENLTLVANFEMTGYILTLIANPEEGGIALGSGIYNAGDTINIIAISNPGWNFVNWIDSEGNLISNQPDYSFIMPAEDLTLIANFEMTGYTLTLIANPEEGGTVIGSGIYNAGDTVNISAIPNTGWEFINWTDSEGNLISNQSEYSFLMPAEDLILIANFEMTGYTLMLVANPEEGGTVIGSGIYNAGDTVNISAIPNTGWEYINWTDSEGNFISNQSAYSFLMPAEDLALIANFEMTGYSLTLIANPEEGGTVIGSGIYNAGDSVNISAIPNTGWEYINWTDTEGNLISNQSEYSFVMPAENLTLVANFEMTGYILTLVANPEEGGAVVGSGIYNAGDTINIIATPNTGWNFINWTDTEGNLISNQPEYSFLMPAEDLTLVANFEMTGYILTLVANPEEGGAVIGSGIYNAGDTINIIATPNEGWTFINWTDTEGNFISNQSAYSFLMPIEDLTLVANFEMTGYTLTLVANPEEGGTVVGSGIYNAGDTVNISALPNTGWEFINWTDTEGNLISNQPAYSFIMPAEDLSLIANFEMTGYTLMLVANPEDGGTVIGSGIYNAGDIVNISAIPNTGWEFINWTDSEGNLISNQSEYSFLMPAEDLTLIANFEMTGYILTLVANPEEGGAVIGSGIYNAGDTVNISAIPNTGWEFINWTDIEGNLISNQSEYSFLMPAEDHTLVANFEMTGYILTLVANPEEGGAVVGSGIYNAGDTVNISAIPNTGWEFINWTDSEGNLISNQSEYSFLMPAEDLALIANFEMTGYILTLVANPEEGGTVMGSGIYNAGDIVNISAIPNTGWEFINWTDSEGNLISNQSEYSFLMPAENLTLVANFEMTGYILTLIANPEEGGIALGSGIYNAGDTINIIAISNPGWNFVNWIDSEGNLISNQPDYSFIMPAEDLTLIANFEMTGYTLTLVANPEAGGIVLGAGIYNFGDQVNIYSFPNTGYTFISWTDINGNIISTNPATIITMPAGNHTLIANFGLINYTLTLIANPSAGGIVTGAGNYNYGSIVNINAVPNAGYSFVNWTNLNGNIISTDPSATISMPSNNLTLIANFQPISYTLTLIANPSAGGTVAGAGNYNYGNIVNINAIPNAGYVFVNWTNLQGNVISTEPATTISMPPNNLTLIANFEPVVYTLTLIVNPTEGGTVSGGGNYNQGETVIINAIPNTGYNFVNWTNLNGSVISTNPDATFAMPDNNLTLIANFQLITYTVTFEIKDESNNPVTYAIITLGNMSNEAGDYTFENVAPGMYNYEITAQGYQTASGVVAVSQDEIFHIVLHKIMCNIMASAGENGFIEPFGINTVVYGGSQSFLIQANEGFHIADVLIDDVSIGPVSEYEFVNVTSNHSIHAIFEINAYTISVDINNSDWGIVTGSGIHEHGQLVTLEAIAYSGYRFIEWREYGAVVSTDTLLMFTALKDRSLLAVFDFTDNTSFEEYSDPVVSVYPNPAGDMATISFENSNVTVEAIVIFDIQGREIWKYLKPDIINDKIILNISNYITGTYMVQIITTEGVLSKRLIVI